LIETLNRIIGSTMKETMRVKLAGFALKRPVDRIGAHILILGAMVLTPQSGPFAAFAIEGPNAQSSNAEPAAEPKPPAMDGLWPTPTMQRLTLRRWAHEVGERYELDDRQREEVEKSVVERWSKFLTEHRAELQPLLNEYLELHLELEPPDGELVKEWANRALPTFQKVRDQIVQGTSDIRKVLTPLQRAKFEVEALAMTGGLATAEMKIRGWQEGRYEREDFWFPTRAERRKRREEEKAAQEKKEKTPDSESAESRNAASPPEPEDQIALELKGWDEFVAQFIKEYSLDDSQRVTAMSCLSEMKQRAQAYRDKYRYELESLEQEISRPKPGDFDAAPLEARIRKLYSPVDEMFAELKNRLEPIPTTTQRQAAKNKEAATSSIPGRTNDR